MRKGKGFTLLELMIVVGIIAILASVAIPAYLTFIRGAKTSEAVVQIRKIYDGEIAYFDASQVDQGGGILSAGFVSAGPNPATPPAGQKVLSNWTDPAWAELKFGLDAASYYRYTAVAAGVRSTASFTARAEGDLDGDGSTSLFERTAGVDPTSGEVLGGSGIYKVNELE